MTKNNDNIYCNHNTCRPASCNKFLAPMHGHKHGFHHAPGFGFHRFNNVPAYGFTGRPMGCHAHDPMHGFDRGPVNHCGNGRPFFKGCPAPEFHFFRTDIRTTETGYLLEAELPGFKKDEIAVDLEGRNLKITAKKAEPAETKEGENACPDKAKRPGTYCRVFRLNGIRTEDVTASYEDGILRIDLPKKERPAPEKKSITIN